MFVKWLPGTEKSFWSKLKQKSDISEINNDFLFVSLNGPHRDKICLLFRYDTFQVVNNKCADLSARMRRLVCAFGVRKRSKTKHCFI